MVCPRCGQRKAKRSCPALERTICTVCCATERLVTIDCPEDCPHLASARAFPAATTRRQQEADVSVLLPSIRELTERQYQLFFLFQNVIAQAQPEGLMRVTDRDVADAAGSVAKALETAVKGVIYEEWPAAPIARKLAEGFRGVLAQVREQGITIYDREAAITLRAVEAGALTVGHGPGTGDTAYLDLMTRLLQVNRAKSAKTTLAGGSGGFPIIT
jgi:hypothetical protein